MTVVTHHPWHRTPYAAVAIRRSGVASLGEPSLEALLDALRRDPRLNGRRALRSVPGLEDIRLRTHRDPDGYGLSAAAPLGVDLSPCVEVAIQPVDVEAIARILAARATSGALQRMTWRGLLGGRRLVPPPAAAPFLARLLAATWTGDLRLAVVGEHAPVVAPALPRPALDPELRAEALRAAAAWPSVVPPVPRDPGAVILGWRLTPGEETTAPALTALLLDPNGPLLPPLRDRGLAYDIGASVDRSGGPILTVWATTGADGADEVGRVVRAGLGAVVDRPPPHARLARAVQDAELRARAARQPLPDRAWAWSRAPAPADDPVAALARAIPRILGRAPDVSVGAGAP